MIGPKSISSNRSASSRTCKIQSKLFPVAQRDAIVGGLDMMSQSIALSKRPHVIVATPGRLMDHLENTKGFSLKALKPNANGRSKAGNLLRYLVGQLTAGQRMPSNARCLTGWAQGPARRKAAAIQVEAIPPALEGRDIIGLAQTGSGKTAAFSLPILQTLWENPQPFFALKAGGIASTWIVVGFLKPKEAQDAHSSGLMPRDAKVREETSTPIHTPPPSCPQKPLQLDHLDQNRQRDREIDLSLRH
jgi:hypothetical protein